MITSLCNPTGSCRNPSQHTSMDCYAKYIDLCDPDEYDLETYEEWQRSVSEPI